MRGLYSNFVKASKQNTGVYDYCAPDYSALTFNFSDVHCMIFLFVGCLEPSCG